MQVIMILILAMSIYLHWCLHEEEEKTQKENEVIETK
jgi:hypothetical protein